MEILAPCGTMESLHAAIRAGADAVYLGYRAFSARSGAGNFDEDELREAIRLAHLHHVRVHVTVNILIKDTELDEVRNVLGLVWRLGADAVLIQDLGAVELARACFPALHVHASTQMALHNRTGAMFAKNLGMTRVVLARECTAAEAALACGQGIEVELFGHGAQCVSVSGECLLSSQIGSRSGNRGRCAQPCRLMYTWRGHTGAYLSPRDICLRNRLDEMEQMGVASLKIEGRLKRPEYVSCVTSSYRSGLDRLHSDKDWKAGAEEMRALRQIFQRGGFMEGHFAGEEDAAVIEPEHVSHQGTALGTVTGCTGRLARVRLDWPLEHGDEISFPGGDMIYSGIYVKTGDTAVIRLRDGLKVEIGDAVRLLVSQRQLEMERERPMPRIPVSMHLRAYPGHALELTITDGTSTVRVTGPEADPARNRAMTEEDARTSLEKTGDTPFEASEISVETAGAFVPRSVLNELRRRALEEMQEARIRDFAPEIGTESPAPEIRLPGHAVPPLLIFRTPDQLKQVPENVRLCWRPEDYRIPALEKGLQGMPGPVWLHLPVVCGEQTLDSLQRFIQQHRERISGIVLGSVGQLGRKWDLPYGAGSGIPVMNRRSAGVLFRLGCEFVTASTELDADGLRQLTRGEPDILVPAAGRQTLMLLSHCPARVRKGLDRNRRDCRMCDADNPDSVRGTSLRDRKGAEYPLIRERLPEGCEIRMLQMEPVNILRQVRALGMNWSAEVTVETDLPHLLAEPSSEGHWKRAVE